MKKVVLSLAFVAAVLVSCNKKAEETPAADSTAVDTTAAPAVDTTAVDTTAAPAVDTAKVAAEAPAKEEVKH
jgi:PBP1b-binding outer membrane lipoprotein LpoB